MAEIVVSLKVCIQVLNITDQSISVYQNLLAVIIGREYCERPNRVP